MAVKKKIEKRFEEVLGTLDVEAGIPTQAGKLGVKVRRKPPTRKDVRAHNPGEPLSTIFGEG